MMRELRFPLTALTFLATNGRIDLSIEELYGFPNQLAVGGGYEAQAQLHIAAGPYQVEAPLTITTGQLFAFLSKLDEAYGEMRGEAELSNGEDGGFALTCSINRQGHVVARGHFQAQPALPNRLEFELISDQTQVHTVVHQLKGIAELFGGSEGLR